MVMSQKRFAPGRSGARLNLMSTYQVPAFLSGFLHARSPSGSEAEAQAVYDQYVKPHAAAYANDALGNRLASLNPKGAPTLMLAGRMDELGLIITYVNKDGFLLFRHHRRSRPHSSRAAASSSRRRTAR